jgi:DNA-binding CsgD family transcriptional regulator
VAAVLLDDAAMGSGGGTTGVRAVLLQDDRDVAEVLTAVFRAAGVALRTCAHEPGTPEFDQLVGGLDEHDLVLVDCTGPGEPALARLVEAALSVPCALVVIHPRLGAGHVAPGLPTSRPVWWWPADFRVLTVLDQVRLHVAASVAARAAGETRAEIAQLSSREQQVLELVAQGRSNTDIAEQLDLAPGTVKTYVARGKDKLGQPTRSGIGRVLRLGRR